MDAKAIKKISQAHSGMQMGKIIKQIVDTAVVGGSSVTIKDQIDESIQKYVTNLGYKIEKSDKGLTVSW